MIARAETAQAFSYAKKQAALATEMDLNRTLLATLDERLWPICVPLHGVTVPMNKSYPDQAVPGNAYIPCRCTKNFEVAK